MKEATVHRKTRETDITVSVRPQSGGEDVIRTGIGFFDHMLEALRAHAGIGLEVRASGDLDVDCHHTVEDTGITLGQALGRALGDKAGVARFGHCLLPMDETLALCALDISGRPYLVFDCAFRHAMTGGMETAMTGEFFRALCMNAGITLHLRVLYGENDHHKIEALFKAFAHALRMAIQPAGDGAALSTKGALDV